MAKLVFESWSFNEQGDKIEAVLLNNFSLKIPLEEFSFLSELKVQDGALLFKKISEEQAEHKVNLLLASHLSELKNKRTGNKAVYFYPGCGIPLIGNVAWGIVYRDSSLIELKPQTSCNLNCIYCSVGEGINSQKTDFVIDKDYLLEEFDKLLDFIGEPVEAHIGVQGEPFLYADLLPLIKELNDRKKVQVVSLDTNGTILTKRMIDELSANQKLRLNISLNAMDQEIAEKLAGTAYNLQHVLENIRYAATKIKLLIAPLYVPGYNEEEMPKIIEFVKSLKLTNKPFIGIQNFLQYSSGRHPAKQAAWEQFRQKTKAWATESGINIDLKPEDFGIRKTKPLPKPFKEGEIIKARVVCEDRFSCARVAVAKGRNISINPCHSKTGAEVKVEITRDKHNIFTGKLIK